MNMLMTNTPHWKQRLETKTRVTPAADLLRAFEMRLTGTRATGELSRHR